MSYLFSRVLDSAKYAVGGVVDAAINTATSPSGQLVLMGLLLASFPPAVLAGASGALSVAVFIKDQKTNDDDAAPLKGVDIRFSPTLPEHIKLKDVGLAVATTIKTKFTVKIAENAEIGQGVLLASASRYGRKVEAYINFSPDDPSASVNVTGIQALLQQCAADVNPVPANRGDGSHASEKYEGLMTAMAVAAGTLAVAHIAMDCRKHYLAQNRQVALDGGTAPLIPAPAPAAGAQTTVNPLAAAPVATPATATVVASAVTPSSDAASAQSRRDAELYN